MSDPIVFISHFRLKEGKVDAYMQLQGEIVQALQLDKPRTTVYTAYLDESSTHVTIVHVFPDAESMDLHFQGSDERSRAAYEFLVPNGWEIYGTPSDPALETMRQEAASSGVTLTVQTQYVAGFLRAISG